jgi:hypothetical protein
MTVIIDTTAVINSIRMAQQAGNPAAPAAGYWQMFIKAGGLYIENSAGTVYGPIGTGLYMEQLYENTLAAPGEFNFAGIPGTFDHLKVYLHVLSSHVIYEEVAVNVNNDAVDANYWNASVKGGSGAVEIGSSFQLRNLGSMGITAGYYTFVELDIPNYADITRAKIIKYTRISNNTNADDRYAEVGGLTWLNTAAINRLTFVNTSWANGLAAGSYCQIIGIRSSL